MASYQEMETRLIGLEERVAFIMQTAQMTAAISSGLVGDDGQPLPPKMYRGSLEDMFKLSKQMPTQLESEDGRDSI